MECGDLFLHLISEIYFQQYTSIFINEDLPNPLKLCKGTRQVCPLSPLLFVLTLEPLLIQLRNNNEVKELKIRKQEYKIQAFADDIFLILEDPENSIQATVEILEQYRRWAKLKVNKNKM